MKRVAVIGCPGAGKSTFSRTLAEKTSLPLVYLDRYYHGQLKDYYKADNRRAWLNKVTELTSEDRWLIDGNYSSTFRPRFDLADKIIFLDYPRRITFYRALKRIAVFGNQQRVDMPSDWREKLDFSFLRYVWNFNKQDRQKIFDAMSEDNHKKLVIFCKPSEATKYLEAL